MYHKLILYGIQTSVMWLIYSLEKLVAATTLVDGSSVMLEHALLQNMLAYCNRHYLYYSPIIFVLIPVIWLLSAHYEHITLMVVPIIIAPWLSPLQ